MDNANSQEKPNLDRNVTDAGIDPDQLTAQGLPNDDLDELAETADMQLAGARNVRVTGHEKHQRNAEFPVESNRTAYDSGENGDAVGITNRPLSAEKQSQHEVGSEEIPPAPGKQDIREGDLPKPGFATVTDTVEISTETPKR